MFTRTSLELVDEEVNEVRRVQWLRIDSLDVQYGIIHGIVSVTKRKSKIHTVIHNIGTNADIARLNHAGIS